MVDRRTRHYNSQSWKVLVLEQGVGEPFDADDDVVVDEKTGPYLLAGVETHAMSAIRDQLRFKVTYTVV